jgi:hypothetical protein
VLLRELRRLPWLNGAGSPVRFFIRRVLIAVALVLVLYGGWLIWQWFMPGCVSNLYDRSSCWFSYATQNFMFFVGAVSLVAALPMDYVSMRAALNSINGEMISGTWDLLRLTAVREGELVLAKHAGAQLRAWRSMATVIGLRVAVALVSLIFFAHEYVWSTRRFGFDAGAPFGYFILNLLPFALLYGVFIIEPLWRMRAVTALGMVISARSTDASASALSAMGALLAFWLAQLVVAAAVVAGFSVLLFSIALFGIGALCAPLLALLVLFSTLYGFYSVLKTWSLRQVARRVASYTH